MESTRGWTFGHLCRPTIVSGLWQNSNLQPTKRATGIEALFDRITRNGRASKTGSPSVFGFRNQRASRRGSYRTTLYEALQDQQLTRYVRMASAHKRQLVVGLEQAPRLGSFLRLGL
ncbi:hypothetical protein V8C43DRAFT_272069, partial [Trichoderma afarasin]